MNNVTRDSSALGLSPAQGVVQQIAFGSVAPIRPYLFQKCFLLLLAMDVLVLMIERGARYGVDQFNVSHFSWLDRLHDWLWQSHVPSTHYYVACLTLTSFGAFCLVLGGPRRWLMGLVTLLYTYCWAMSRLDSYLHHYMISLIMLCITFFPAVDPRTLRAQLNSAPERDSGRASHGGAKHVVGGGVRWRSLALQLLCLALGYRLLLSQAVGLSQPQRWLAMFACFGLLVATLAYWRRFLPAGSAATTRVSAWSYRLLGTTVGVIYIFTSIAKMDPYWCGGHTLREVGTTADVLAPVEFIAGWFGVPPGWFWAGLATFVIPLELTLAASYLVATWQDEANRKWLPRWCLFVWLLAIGLHLNNEMMNLIIQWFGYYMLFLATLILLPADWLLLAGAVFYVPESSWRDAYEARVQRMTGGQAMLALGVVSFLALVLVIAVGFHALIVGVMFATCVIAAGLVALLVLGMLLGWERRSLVLSGIVAGAALCMIVTVQQCSMRYDYYRMRGKTYLLMYQYREAVEAMEQAVAFPAPDRQAACDLCIDLGVAYRQLGDQQKAERSYRAAVAANPYSSLAYYGLGNLLSPVTRRHDEAIACYRQAIEIKPDFSDAWVNLGDVLAFHQQADEARRCYQAALEIEPQATDIQQRLAQLEESE